MNHKSINNADLIVAEELWNKEIYHIYFYDINKSSVFKDFNRFIPTKYPCELFDCNYAEKDLELNFYDIDKPLLVIRINKDNVSCKLLFNGELLEEFKAFSIDDAVTYCFFNYPNIFKHIGLEEIEILENKLNLLETVRNHPVVFFDDSNGEVIYFMKNILFISSGCFIGKFLLDALNDMPDGFFIIKPTSKKAYNNKCIYELVGQNEFINTYCTFIDYKELLFFLKNKLKGRCF